MEKDDEVKGEGNSYTTHFRQFDPRVGRWFSLDPVYKNNASNYSSMSNNPITRVDPRGDDDYYNEKGKFLYRDTKTSNEIRLMKQKDYDRIHGLYAKQMWDNSKSYKGLLEELDNNSKIVENTITGSEIKKLWKDSRMDVPLKFERKDIYSKGAFDDKSVPRRKEASAMIVLDIKEGKIKLILNDTKNNNANTSYMGYLERVDKEGNTTQYGHLTDVVYYNGNRNLIVLGNIHVHPFTKKEAYEYGMDLNLPYNFESADAQTSFNYNIPVYQLQYNIIGKQLSTSKSSPGGIGTHEEAVNGKIDIGKDALETTGGNPEITYPSPDSNKGG
jgi:RHS repeat-associated protein